ncbi:glycoside hydrolase family 5 protein [Mycolicibacterium rufum]|uniref:Glycoside hydrolase family 5 protein n=1 Tax=Mycolicibacterium rufum TaxID=318424 RepID=A0ABY3UFX7_9MYCO|nr:glycoside hydrolase family 5 protein [Mycolicibacterium rufum]
MIVGSVSACQLHGAAVAIGMTVHYRSADTATLDQQFDAMAAMKVTWVRVDVDWSVIEPVQNRLNWGASDALVDRALAHGMRVLLVLAFTPPWTTSRPDSNRVRPDDPAAFANFARVAAQHYAARGVHHWEIWNEPNTGKFWPPAPGVAEYGRLFRAAAGAVRDVDPEATLLIGGLSPTYGTPTADVDPATYLRRLYDDGAAQIADGIAVHPYTFPSLPTSRAQRTTGGFRDLPALHDLMVQRGDGDKKVWITEYGAPTGTGAYAVSEQDQASTLLQARQVVDTWDWAGPLIYYELEDGGTDPAEIEQNFGVLRADGSFKLAAIALIDTASGVTLFG